MSATGGFPVNIGCVLLTASARLPTMGSPFSVGYDLFPNRPVTIDSYDRCLVSTGLCKHGHTLWILWLHLPEVKSGALLQCNHDPLLPRRGREVFQSLVPPPHM